MVQMYDTAYLVERHDGDTVKDVAICATLDDARGRIGFEMNEVVPVARFVESNGYGNERWDIYVPTYFTIEQVYLQQRPSIWGGR